MHGQKANAKRDLERDTLRLLCSVLLQAGTRRELCGLLEPSLFRDPLQRVIFEEIRGLGGVESRMLGELLPARVTNRGFPEFDLHEFLAPHQATEEEIEKLFESAIRLLDLSHPDEESLAE